MSINSIPPRGFLNLSVRSVRSHRTSLTPTTFRQRILSRSFARYRSGVEAMWLGRVLCVSFRYYVSNLLIHVSWRLQQLAFSRSLLEPVPESQLAQEVCSNNHDYLILHHIILRCSSSTTRPYVRTAVLLLPNY
jgi:hypothetical protein